MIRFFIGPSAREWEGLFDDLAKEGIRGLMFQGPVGGIKWVMWFQDPKSFGEFRAGRVEDLYTSEGFLKEAFPLEMILSFDQRIPLKPDPCLAEHYLLIHKLLIRGNFTEEEYEKMQNQFLEGLLYERHFSPPRYSLTAQKIIGDSMVARAYRNMFPDAIRNYFSSYVQNLTDHPENANLSDYQNVREILKSIGDDISDLHPERTQFEKVAAQNLPADIEKDLKVLLDRTIGGQYRVVVLPKGSSLSGVGDAALKNAGRN